MNIVDRARIESAVKSYDWWLDLRGAPGRRRRELRRELRANLLEAAATTDAKSAVAALGSTRAMAAEAIEPDPKRPRWTAAANAAIFAFAGVILIEVFASLAWMDGAMAADKDARVAGSMTLFPGSSLEYAPQANGFDMTIHFGWLCLAAAALVFVAVARPWRAFRRRDRGLAPSGA